MTRRFGNCGACLSKRFIDDVAFGFRATVKMGEALVAIARGGDSGPIAPEAAQQMARECFTALGLTWAAQGGSDATRT